MKGEDKMIFEKLNTTEILTLVKNLDINRDTLVFLKGVDYHAQLHLKIDEEAYRLIEIVFTCGGVVSRADLVDIIYEGDKNIYPTIRKLIDYKLLKIDSRRDSNLFLTSNSLSIMKGRKIKNGIDYSKASETQLAKSRLILTLIKENKDMMYSEKDLLDLIISRIDLNEIPGDENEYMSIVKNESLKCHSSISKLNCYLSSDRTMIAMYVKNNYDLNKKFKELLKLNLAKTISVNITRIVILTLDEFDYDETRSTLIRLHQDHEKATNLKCLSSNISSLKLEILN
jgi:hypothetical protein